MEKLTTLGDTLAVESELVKLPTYSKETTIMTGVLDDVPVIGLHTPGVETFIIPLSMFMLMMEVYVEVYAPGEEEHYQ